MSEQGKSIGKHDIGAPINEALELHYKEEARLRDERIKALEEEVNDSKLEIERLNFDIKMHKAHIEELEKALVKMTIEAASK